MRIIQNVSLLNFPVKADKLPLMAVINVTVFFLFITKWLPHKFKIYRLSSECSKVKKYVNF